MKSNCLCCLCWNSENWHWIIFQLFPLIKCFAVVVIELMEWSTPYIKWPNLITSEHVSSVLIDYSLDEESRTHFNNFGWFHSAQIEWFVNTMCDLAKYNDLTLYVNIFFSLSNWFICASANIYHNVCPVIPRRPSGHCQPLPSLQHQSDEERRKKRTLFGCLIFRVAQKSVTLQLKPAGRWSGDVARNGSNNSVAAWWCLFYYLLRI